jgi:hypothetical protein
MRSFPYDNEETSTRSHNGVSFIWLVADTKISTDCYPPSFPYFPQPPIIGGILIKVVVMPLNG